VTTIEKGDLVSCINDPQMVAAFERSNVPSDARAACVAMIDDGLAEGGIVSAQISPWAEISQLEVFRSPGGENGQSDQMLMVGYDLGIWLLARKRFRGTDKQSLFFDELPGLSLIPDERSSGGSGQLAIQASVGGSPIFRLGWTYSSVTGAANGTRAAATAERDRILGYLQRWAR
jgi:hypothetical protein